MTFKFQHNGVHAANVLESVTGLDIEVNYVDFRDSSGEVIEVGDSAGVRANTGSVSLDRNVYPVPFGTDNPPEPRTCTMSLLRYDTHKLVMFKMITSHHHSHYMQQQVDKYYQLVI